MTTELYSEVKKLCRNLKRVLWDDVKMRILIIFLTLGSIFGVIDNEFVKEITIISMELTVLFIALSLLIFLFGVLKSIKIEKKP